MAVFFFALKLCLFLSFDDVTTNETTVGYDFNTTDQNTTFNVFAEDFNVTTLQPDVTTTPTPPETGEPVPVPEEPLPVAGRLPGPAPHVSSVCSCDEQDGVCDINCCCDRFCSNDQEVHLFTSCSVRRVSSNQQQCSREVASYWLIRSADRVSELQTSVTMETSSDVFCVQTNNRDGGFLHPPPVVPTNSNFDFLFKGFSSFFFSSEETSQLEESAGSSSSSSSSSGYQYGDVLSTFGDEGQKQMFLIPAAGLSAECVDSPAAFLQQLSSRCSRRVDLQQRCSSLPQLNMNTYTHPRLLAGKNTDAEVSPVHISSVVLQSLEGTQTELQIKDLDPVLLDPVLLNPDLCANVVLKVVYVLRFSPAGLILNVSVSVVLGFVRTADSLLEQQFDLRFIQQDSEGAELYSGNPGYVVGLPLVSGRRTEDGFVRSLDPGVSLSVLHSSEDQDCLRGRVHHSPVLFGLDSLSGCTLSLEDIANCSLVSLELLEVLRGPNHPEVVSTFGNSPLQNPLDWLPIRTSFSPEDGQSCSLPLSRHLEIQWTQYGSLRNPQAQILSITETIQTNRSSLDQITSGSRLSISSSVTFVSVSADARPGFRAAPAINARLPFDFFFPFV